MVVNTRHQFQFVIEVDGLEAFEAQKVTLPEIEVETATHGGANHDIPTPGRIKYGDLVIEKIRPLVPDSFAMNWINSTANPMTGTGGLASNISRTVVIRELSPDGTVAINSWVCYGCFPKRLAQDDFDRMSSDNIKQRLTLAVTKMEHL